MMKYKSGDALAGRIEYGGKKNKTAQRNQDREPN